MGCVPQATFWCMSRLPTPSTMALTRYPSNFTVAVSGLTNASPSTFPGSISGTPCLTLLASYSVVVLQPQRLQRLILERLHRHCNFNGQNSSALCVVTGEQHLLSTTTSTQLRTHTTTTKTQPLTCAPRYQTVNIGQTVSFSSQGGDYSQYNWQTPQRSVP